MGKDTEVSFMKFSQEEPYLSMSTSEAWEEYLVKVKGKMQKELDEFNKVN